MLRSSPTWDRGNPPNVNSRQNIKEPRRLQQQRRLAVTHFDQNERQLAFRFQTP
jgi:hypothetical protein